MSTIYKALHVCKLNMAVNEIHSYLATQHIKIPNDWLDACLEWLQSENRGRHVQLAQLQQQVLDQWLLTDLKDLAVPCLPSSILNEKYTLNGCYCVQMVSVLDVSQPLYGQLLQVQNLDNSNSSVSAETQPTQKRWESKSSRMLMMTLTDGVITVSGMEYRSIPILNDALLPGTKIRIKGPVLCRKGVLMLTAGNVQLLGGEVDDLKQSNSKEALLCRALNRPLPAPNRQRQPVQVSRDESYIELDLPPDVITQLTDERFEISADSGFASARAQTNNRLRDSIDQHGSAPRLNEGHDVDMEDVDDNDFLNEAERLESQINSQGCGNLVGLQKSKDISGSSSRTRKQSGSGVVFVEDPPGGNNQPMQDTDRSTHNTSRQMSIEDAFRQNFKPPPTKRLPTQTLNLTGGTPAQDRSAWSGDRTRNVPVLSGSSAAGSSKTSAFLEPPHNGKGSVAAKKSSRPEAGEPPVVIELDSDQEFEACPSLTSRVRKTLPATSSARMRSDVDRPSPSSRVCSSAATIDLTRDCPQMPVRYICQLRSCDKKQFTNAPLKVKAFIVTLLSKLHCDPETGWSLNGRICDGTAVLDVEFSDPVLNELVGFSAKQANQIKRSGDRQKVEKLRAGMANCREAIIDMCKIMHVTFVDDRARVVALSDTDESYWSGLCNRTCS